jgi:Inositol monophosphatase family
LKSAFPDSVVIGEESTHREPALLQTIADAELAFIVDPIDGTRNFASNLPLFGVMAAVTMRGEIIAGVIHDPVCRYGRLQPGPALREHRLSFPDGLSRYYRLWFWPASTVIGCCMGSNWPFSAMPERLAAKLMPSTTFSGAL